MELTKWSCPVCGGLLCADAQTLRCENGHCYDVAKKGYVNLLLSNRSAQKRHGDDRAMVAARTAFLDSGSYAPLRAAIAETAVGRCPAAPTVLDVGCGEGYYTAAVHDALCAAGKTPEVYGVDISREALIAAHRRLPALSLAVATLSRLPMADGRCDLMMNVFAPADAQEFHRVLRPGGTLLRVVPLERHLWELKCAVYDVPYENKPPETELEGFRLAERRDIVSRITLRDAAEIEALFRMTPYYYKTSRADQEKLARLQTLETETAFGLLVYEKI